MGLAPLAELLLASHLCLVGALPLLALSSDSRAASQAVEHSCSRSYESSGLKGAAQMKKKKKKKRENAAAARRAVCRRMRSYKMAALPSAKKCSGSRPDS